MALSATNPFHDQDSQTEAPGLLHDFALPIRAKPPTLPPPAGFIHPAAPSSGSGELLSVEKRSSSLEPGEIKCFPTPYSPGRFGRDTPEQKPLGSIDLSFLSPGQLVFGFGIVCIMAKLHPTVQFKFGDRSGSMIGARLTLYGHTVSLEPKFPTVEKAWITACRLALEHLQKLNPDWAFPPLPIDGPTTAEWDWSRLLKDYCLEKARPHASYALSPCDNGLYHCEVQVGYERFRTTRQCRGVSEAKNTSAHIALHALMTTEWSRTDTQFVLPAESNLLPEVTSNFNSELQETKPIFGELPTPSSTFLSGISLGHVKLSRRGKPVIQGSQSGVNKNNKQKPKPKRRNRRPPRILNSPTKPGMGASNTAQGNANNEPVTNCRWTETPKCVVVEDKLLILKAVRDKLAALGKDASFHSLLKGICEEMKIQPPRIEPQVNKGTLLPIIISAQFDASHPYLCRASPIYLATAKHGIDSHDAGSLGIKKMILYLLKMLREDAGLTGEDAEYPVELRALRDLEAEVESHIQKSDWILKG